MKRIGVLVFLLVSSTSLFAQNAAAVKTYLVGTRGQALTDALAIMRDDLPKRSGRSNFRAFESVNAFSVEMTADEAASLKKSPRVSYVEEEVEYHALSDSVVAGAETTPYGVAMVNAPQVWPVTKGTAVNSSTTINLAILDTGIDYNNPELKRAYKGGWNTFASNANPLDDHGHGTHVAGTVAAAQNAAGVTGVAPDVNIWSVKVLDTCGSGSSSNIIAGIDWVLEQKAALGGNWIMSLSLGSDGQTVTERNAYQKAYDAGVLTLAASGNSYSGTDGVAFPAGYPSVIAIGAIDSDMNVASFSQRGTSLKLVAPGVNVLSTWIGEQVATNDGRVFDANLPVTKTFCLSNPAVSSSFVFCGFGGSASDFPASVAGKIALIQRGTANPSVTVSFAQKAKNAKSAGAIGAVIYNNTDGMVYPDLSAETSSATFVPFAFISQADGESLKATPNATVSLSFGRQSFALENGTSMSTPHASAAAALVWSVAPNATNEQVKTALINNAHDLGASGFDTTFGFGLIDAYAAAKSLAPGAFGSPTQPPPTQQPSGRRSLKRGN